MPAPTPSAPGSRPGIGVLYDVCYGFDSCASTHINGGDTEHNVESFISFMLGEICATVVYNQGLRLPASRQPPDKDP